MAVRAGLAGSLRSFIADYGEVAAEAGYSVCPWFRRLEALEAGEPVLAQGWEVSRWVTGGPAPEGNDWVRVEPDGWLTPMVLIHRADGVVDWVPRG